MGTKLVTELSLSTHKASKVCLHLEKEGIILPTPSQSGIFKRLIRCGEEQKLKIKNLPREEKDYCLHFDGKKLSESKGKIKHAHEYQVICLQSSTKEIKLGVVRCESGSSESIFKGISSILDDYDAWSSIKMIIFDTTAVNTGHINGVVVRIQQRMLQMGQNVPQYLGCQHHIFNRILRHVLDFYLDKHTSGLTLNYKFIDEIIEGYEVLKEWYIPKVEMPVMENPGWRDDFRFLYILCFAFRQYKENRKLPRIIWRSLPSIHSARWNSRAIYSLIAYFLLPNWRAILEKPVTFIAFGWQEVWFFNQKFKNEKYDNLLSNTRETKSRTAEKCFKTHWSQENSVIDIPRSNIIGERGIKPMEELNATCKTYTVESAYNIRSLERLCRSLLLDVRYKPIFD